MRPFIVLLLIAFSQSLWAWGPQGHMIVGEIASRKLTPAAQKATALLLKGNTLAEVANWADSIKGAKEWVHTKPWHYVDIADGEDYSTMEHSHDGDAIVAITDMVAVLKNSKSTADDKTNALKFIVHFVGDIHQPLHVGRPDDQGGNGTKILYEGRNTNLHAVWDSLMIMKSPMSYEQYADSLIKGTMQMKSGYDIAEFKFSQVIAECMGVRNEIYNFGKDQGPIKLGAAYYTRSLETMNQQLLHGGERLALLLNTIYK